MSTVQAAVAGPAPGGFSVRLRRLTTYFSKPWNAVLLVLGIVLTISTLAPLAMILLDTVTVHAGSVDDPTGAGGGFTLLNWQDLFGGRLVMVNFVTPLVNTVVMAIIACAGAILYGGFFAYLVTRTNLAFKKYLSAIFIFPYIMPQWTLAVVWDNLFTSREISGGSDGLLAYVFGIHTPSWLAEGIVPSGLVLAMHYAPFAYILIGAIFRNMDANLEEAATILNTPRWKTFTRITLPMVTPAVLSTTLLVFSSAMGSYPVPHYLRLTTLATKYVQMNVNRQGQASILAVTMMLFGIALMVANQLSTSSRRSYTTVTGKSGQSSRVNLGAVGSRVIAVIFLLTTLFTSIYPILAFAFETFLPNPGDYSFLKTGDPSNLTTKWWLTTDNNDGAMFGQYGILFNSLIWGAVGRTLIVAVFTALCAGTIGLLVGYSVAKNRRSRWANWVNNMAFLPYLMPSLAVGVAFFIFGSNLGIFNTLLLLVIAGTVKYIPFASRAALNSMLQLSGEIEESAIIQNIPWWKRMVRIIIPIQKSAIISGYMLPFMSTLRELTLFMLLVSQTQIVTTMLDYFDEMGLYAFSSAINLILIVIILIFNSLVNKLTGASLDKGLGGN
ncbi:MAG: iron ABC transporter permease [Propionicimonas sp.]|uniref:ABC transporter permease n=1 Tax=Propionicimonas sp. TaxID=1955623 RepID=UPI002B1FC19B|nr:iron ABC transporter permease [Propionicimonas sp.]MEA4945105.1 iron ABC transporter permease [Propionicimonas sp.]